MKCLNLCLSIYFFLSASALAQDVGIQFDEMKIGTKLTTLHVGLSNKTYVDEYIGEEDGFYLMQSYELKADKSLVKSILMGFDKNGRQVFSERDGKRNTYTPYKCWYVVGDCSHTYKYYNRFKNKWVTNNSDYTGRLEGQTYILTVHTGIGDSYDVPFDLGPHNLRVSNVYNNAFGDRTGFDLIELSIPE